MWRGTDFRAGRAARSKVRRASAGSGEDRARRRRSRRGRDDAAQDDVPVSVAAHLRVLLNELFENARALLAPLRVSASAPGRERGLGGGLVAAASRRQEDDCGQEVVRAERGEKYGRRHLRQARSPRLSATTETSVRRLSVALRRLHEARYLRVELAAPVEAGRGAAVGGEEGCTQGDGARAGPRDDAARVAAHFGDPAGEIFRAPDRSGEKEHADARRREDDGLLPDVAALLVGEVGRFVEDDEVGVDLLAAAQGVEELVAIDLGRADDERRVRALLAVAREDARSEE